MKSWFRPITISCLLASGPYCQADEVEDRLVDASARIEFISYRYFTIGSSLSLWAPEARVDKAAKALNDALQVPATFEQLVRLASHANPRVRTLALMKLYELRDQKAFPVIAAHTSDSAESFPNVEISPGPKHEDVLVSTEKESVGSLASRLLLMVGLPAHTSFEAWSKTRFGNPDWIGWYDFLYRIAIESTSPVPPEAAPRIAALKEKLAACPPAVRAWLWFGIADDCLMQPAYDTPLATEAEMVEAGRQLGPEALLAFLKDGSRAGLHEAKIDASDRGKRFILQHAKQLFREEDSEALARMGHPIAAADANPKGASELLRKGNFPDYEAGEAMAALLDGRSESETEYVVNWFYTAPGAPRASSAQSRFIREYERRKPADWEKPARALVAHPGFERLDPLDSAYLAIMVNHLSGREVCPTDSLRDEVATRNRLREHFGLAVVTKPVLDSSAITARDPLWSVPLEMETSSSSLSPDGSTLAVAGKQGKIVLLDTDKGAVKGELTAGAEPQVRFRKSDGVLVVADQRGIVSEWDAASGKMIRETRVHRPHSRSILSEAGDLLVATVYEGIGLYDVKTGMCRWHYKINMWLDGFMAFSPDGSRLAVSSGPSTAILLFDTARSGSMARPGGFSSNSPQEVLSPDLNTPRVEPIAQLEGHSGLPCRALFSPDGKYLVSAGRDMKAIVWDGSTGRLIREFSAKDPQLHPYALGFADSPARVILADDWKKVSFFDLESGKPNLAFRLTGSWAREMFAMPGGKRWIGVEQVYRSEGRMSVETGLVECWSVEPNSGR